MNPFKIAGIILLNFIVQTTLLNTVSISNTIPNTTLIIVVSFALIAGKKTGAIIGLSAGLLQDIVFSEVIGINTMIFFSIGLLVGSLDQKVFKENLFFPFVMTIASTVVLYLVQYFFIYFLGIKVGFLELLKLKLFKELVYSGILSVFIYKAILKNYKEPRVKFTKVI